jgi:membrane protein implicated in regulation of membrane protease activity
LPDFLSQLTAFGVFLGIAAIGFLFLLVSLLFGEVFDHLGFDHDHDIGHDHDGDHGGPSFFSPRVMSVFVTAFGGFGAVSTHYGLGVFPSSMVGFASGVFFGSIIYYFARFLYSQQASTQLQGHEMLGRTARVVVSIPAGGVGQVRCHVGDEMVDKIAKSQDGSAIAANAVVKIDQVLGEMVIVRPQ